MARFLHPAMALTYILDDSKTHEDIAKLFGYAVSYVSLLAARENWTDHRKAALEKSSKDIDDLLGETKAEMNMRHAQHFIKVQGKAQAALENIPFERASEASSALKDAVKGEREARGEGITLTLPVMKVILSQEDKPEDDGTADK